MEHVISAHSAPPKPLKQAQLVRDVQKPSELQLCMRGQEFGVAKGVQSSQVSLRGLKVLFARRLKVLNKTLRELTPKVFLGSSLTE